MDGERTGSTLQSGRAAAHESARKLKKTEISKLGHQPRAVLCFPISRAIFFHCARDRKATGSASLLDMPLPRASRELYDVACLAGHRAAIRPIAPLCLNLTLHREERAPTTCHSFWTLERRGERCLAYLATVPEIPHPLGLVGPSLDR